MKKNRSFLPLCIYSIFMLVGYTLPGTIVEKAQNSNKFIAAGLSDFSLHFFSYFLYSILILYGFYYSPKKYLPKLKTIAIATGFGIFIELIQIPLPYRNFGFDDLVFDFFGIITAVTLGGLIFSRKSKMNNEKNTS